MPRLLSILITCLLAVALAAPGESAPAATLAASIDRYVQPLHDLGVFDGVVVVERGGKVLARRSYGYANLELRVPSGPEQRFRIASVSKLFTDVAIGRLWEDGVLTPETLLSRFLPEFPKADSITIKLLLEHRAGVPSLNDLPIQEDAVHANSLDDLIAHIEKQPLDFPPGSRRQYSNGGYAVLGKVIERASGKRYEEFLEQRVLKPLGLEHTGHEFDGFLLEGRAYGYAPDPRLPDRLVPAPYQQMATKTGGGSLYSTADDLVRFARSIDHDNVIRRATWQAMIPRDSGVVAMTGRCPGFNALLLRRLDDDLTVVVLSNNYASGMLWDMGRAFAALALGNPIAEPPYHKDVGLPAADLAKLAGRYAIPEGVLTFLGERVLDIRLEGSHLTMWSGDTPLDVLVAQSDRRFLARNAWSELTFDPGAGRLVYHPLFRPGEWTLTRQATP